MFRVVQRRVSRPPEIVLKSTLRPIVIALRLERVPLSVRAAQANLERRR